jgi:hypothetical protein
LPGGGGRAQRLLVQSTAAHGAMGLMPDPMLQTMQMKNVPTWQYFDVLVARHGFTAHDAQGFVLQLLHTGVFQHFVQPTRQRTRAATLLNPFRQITKRNVQVTDDVQWHSIVTEND